MFFGDLRHLFESFNTVFDSFLDRDITAIFVMSGGRAGPVKVMTLGNPAAPVAVMVFS